MKKRKTARPRPRRQFKFWLYQDVEAESKLTEFIHYCKGSRQFASMIKNGLRLMWSLGERDTTVLYELFPWLVDSLKPPPSTPDSGDLEQKISAAVTAGVQVAMMNMPSLPATPLVGAPIKPVNKEPVPIAKVGEAQAATAEEIHAGFDSFMSGLWQ